MLVKARSGRGGQLLLSRPGRAGADKNAEIVETNGNGRAFSKTADQFLFPAVRVHYHPRSGQQGQQAVDSQFGRDIASVNLILLQTLREVARADYALAASLFGLGSLKTAQRIARMSTTDLQSLAQNPEPIWMVREPKAFAVLLTQIEGRGGAERVELTRLATMLAGAPPPGRDEHMP